MSWSTTRFSTDIYGVLYIAVFLVLSGCTPWTTRYPTVLPSEPRQERLEFQRFDPFTASDMGPETGVRPRDYSTPRTRARSDAEEKFRRGIGASPAPQPYFPQYNVPQLPPVPGF